MAKKSKESFSQQSLFEEPASVAKPAKPAEALLAPTCPRCGTTHIGKSVREPNKYYCQAGCTEDGDNFYFTLGEDSITSTPGSHQEA